jgi:hypothetical protein
MGYVYSTASFWIPSRNNEFADFVLQIDIFSKLFKKAIIQILMFWFDLLSKAFFNLIKKIVYVSATRGGLRGRNGGARASVSATGAGRNFIYINN